MADKDSIQDGRAVRPEATDSVMIPRLIEMEKINGVDPALDALAALHADQHEKFRACGKITPKLKQCVPAVIIDIKRDEKYTCIGNCSAFIAAKEIYGTGNKIWCLVLENMNESDDMLKEIVRWETIMELVKLRSRKLSTLVRTIVESLDHSGYSLITNERRSRRAILEFFGMSHKAYMRSIKSTTTDRNEAGADIVTPIKRRDKEDNNDE